MQAQRHGECDWAGNGIGKEGARGLVDALKTNTVLTKLCLHGEQRDQFVQAQPHDECLPGNEMGDEGARALCDALKTNTTLAQLRLDREQQDHKGTEKKQGTVVCEVAGRQLDWQRWGVRAGRCTQNRHNTDKAGPEL